MLKINFIGDISLNDEYIIMRKKGLTPFNSVLFILTNCDLVIGNLECLIEGSDGENRLKNPRLRTDNNAINYLKDINLGLACLANNHVYDNLEDGFNKTTNYLNSNGIEFIGASTIGNERVPYIYTKNNIKIGILNYVTADTNPSIPDTADVKVNLFDTKDVLSDIYILKQNVDHIIVFIHWGGSMEGSMYPDKYQPSLARVMIEAGADLIIGHHSHTLQPYEIYKGKHIFYSLGNFCFSDVMVEGKKLELDKKRTNPSIILSVDFFKTKYSIQIHGIRNNKDFIEQDNSVIKKKVIQIAYDNNLIFKSPFWEIYHFYEKRIYPIQAYFFANNRNPIKQLFNLKWSSFIKHFNRLLKPTIQTDQS